jgi:cell growth-regulating nucleolar protein
MPEAPSPPQAVPNFQPEPVNVFDFLVGEGTPNPSTLNLAAAEERRLLEAAPLSPSAGALVRFQDLSDDDDDDLVQYGTGPVPAAAFRTPAAKSDRKSKTKDLSTSEKKDKKRKRLHVDTAATGSPDVDQEMTDAPPVLHSGLTGGLQRMMSRPDVFPPSPDYSGDAGEPSPGSPLKRSKHKKGKHDRDRDISLGSQLMSVFTSSKRSSKDHDGERPKKSRKKREHSSQKLLEYKPTNGETNGNHQLVVYKERGDMFMSLVDKGPESERGLSVNKVLRRYHRHRAESGSHMSKATEEKQLFRNLRLRKNDRGEIVLFCEESK